MVCINVSQLFVSPSGYCVTEMDMVLNSTLIFAAVLIIVLNALVLHTFFYHTDMTEPTNSFIANLAAADLLIGFFLVYDVVYNILQFEVYIECVLRMGLFITVNCASALNLAALTLDRFLKITKPYLYMRVVTITKVHVTEIILWIFSLVLGLLPFFGWSTMNLRQICNFFGIMSPSYLYFITSVFTTTLVVMMGAYVKLVCIARRHSRAMESIGGMGRSAAKPTWKSVKTSFIIVGTFVICWTPSGIFMLLHLLTNVTKTMSLSPNVVFTYLLGLGLLNSILNPVIYAREITEFRKRLLKLCCHDQVSNLRRASQRSMDAIMNMVVSHRHSRTPVLEDSNDVTKHLNHEKE